MNRYKVCFLAFCRGNTMLSALHRPYVIIMLCVCVCVFVLLLCVFAPLQQIKFFLPLVSDRGRVLFQLHMATREQSGVKIELDCLSAWKFIEREKSFFLSSIAYAIIYDELKRIIFALLQRELPYFVLLRRAIYD